MAKFLIYDDKIINLFLKEERPSGGAAVQTSNWIKGLLEAGQEVQILTNLNKPGTLKEEWKDVSLIASYDPDKEKRWVR